VVDWGRLLSGCRGKNLDRRFESCPPRCKYADLLENSQIDAVD
jgi:hypothetical protein